MGKRDLVPCPAGRLTGCEAPAYRWRAPCSGRVGKRGLLPRPAGRLSGYEALREDPHRIGGAGHSHSQPYRQFHPTKVWRSSTSKRQVAVPSAFNWM
ncbi:hypothetical protein TPA0910_06110 [Streptomyces hygroscopicus subsp. sporocinereus]|uniref:Uncharacterized protein n=1 Tax=Streptomyces hygroscopicus TaxID=1912 RepID=A0ABQ3TS68_STRHY|nr:hypothetical protein TPA0910_06110 [Streptomyces hygroscopicus]